MQSDQAASTELKRSQSVETDNAMTPLFIDYVLARSGHKNTAVRNLAAHSGVAFVPDYDQATV
jgi:hypothetical protein